MGEVSAEDWMKGIALSVAASIIGGASKLAIRKSWLMVATPAPAEQTTIINGTSSSPQHHYHHNESSGRSLFGPDGTGAGSGRTVMGGGDETGGGGGNGHSPGCIDRAAQKLRSSGVILSYSNTNTMLRRNDSAEELLLTSATTLGGGVGSGGNVDAGTNKTTHHAKGLRQRSPSGGDRTVTSLAAGGGRRGEHWSSNGWSPDPTSPSSSSAVPSDLHRKKLETHFMSAGGGGGGGNNTTTNTKSTSQRTLMASVTTADSGDDYLMPQMLVPGCGITASCGDTISSHLGGGGGNGMTMTMSNDYEDDDDEEEAKTTTAGGGDVSMDDERTPLTPPDNDDGGGGTRTTRDVYNGVNAGGSSSYVPPGLIDTVVAGGSSAVPSDRQRRGQPQHPLQIETSSEQQERGRSLMMEQLQTTPSKLKNAGMFRNLTTVPSHGGSQHLVTNTGTTQHAIRSGIETKSRMLRYSGMFGMTILNPLCCVLAMQYASPSILAPFSGLTLVWIVLFSEYVVGERPHPTQIMAATLIVAGEVIVALSGDHTNDGGVTMDDIRRAYRQPAFIGYMIAIILWMVVMYGLIKNDATTSTVRRFAWGVSGGTITGLQNFLKDSLTILKLHPTSIRAIPPQFYIFMLCAIGSAFSGLLLLTSCMKRYDATYSSSMFVGSFVISASIMAAVRYRTFQNLATIWNWIFYPLGLFVLLCGIYVLATFDETAATPAPGGAPVASSSGQQQHDRHRNAHHPRHPHHRDGGRSVTTDDANTTTVRRMDQIS